MQDRWPRLREMDVLRDTIEHFLSFESSLWRTLLGLTVRPGVIARAYVGGQRRRYFNPLKYLLVVAGVLALLTWLGLDETQQAESLVERTVAIDPATQEVMSGFFSSLFTVLQDFGRELRLALIPIYAFGLRLVLRRYNLAELTCFAAYALTHASLLAAIGIASLQLVLPETALVFFALDGLGDLFSLVYFTWAVRQFHECGWLSAVASVVSAIVLVAIVALLLFGSLLLPLILSSLPAG